MVTKIAVTDDHEMILQGIVMMLENTADIDVVATYKNASETLANISKHLPDVLLLDINLPDMSGIDLCKKLQKVSPDLLIIGLTNIEDFSFVEGMIKNGARGYLLKNTDKLELLTSISTVLSGELYLQKDLHKRLLDKMYNASNKTRLNHNLTRREQDVLIAISEELTTQEISEKLFISPKTVETHRMNIMSKLGAKNSVGIIKIAMEKGLL